MKRVRRWGMGVCPLERLSCTFGSETRTDFDPTAERLFGHRRFHTRVEPSLPISAARNEPELPLSDAPDDGGPLS